MITNRGGFGSGWPSSDGRFIRAEMARAGRLTVLLRGLAETPDLRLRVLVGEDALDRTVDGVFTTDLLDPRRYLTGGGSGPARPMRPPRPGEFREVGPARHGPRALDARPPEPTPRAGPRA